MIQNSTNLYSTCSFIVDNTPGSGNYSTIGMAITAAESIAYVGPILIKPGIYTEDITMEPGINLTAYPGSESQIVTINGSISVSSAGVFDISNVTLTRETGSVIVVSGTGVCSVVLSNVLIQVQDVGITFYNSNAQSEFIINNSVILSEPSANFILDLNSPGSVNIYYSKLFNLNDLDGYMLAVAVGSLNIQYSLCQYRASASSGIVSYEFCTVEFNDSSPNHIMNILGSAEGKYSHCRINNVQETAACCILFLDEGTGTGTMVSNFIQGHGTNVVGTSTLETPTLYTGGNEVMPAAVTPVEAGIISINLVQF